MKLLRTLPTRRLLALVAAIAALAVGSAAVAVAASGSGGPTPPQKPLDQAIQDALSAPKPDGLSGKLTFTNNLFPSGALLGQAGSALMSGASGRFWVTSDGRGRVELQSDAGDVQIVWSASRVSVYDASSNTVYEAALPKRQSQASSTGTEAPPTLAQIQDVLSRLGAHVTISPAEPQNVGGQPAYGASASPKESGGLLGSLALAWDATHGVPLDVGIFARGSSTPALRLRVDSISFGAVPASDVEVSPPQSAKVVDLGTPAQGPKSGQPESKPLTGLADVQAAAGFPVVAPESVGGLARQQVRLVGSRSKAVLLTYGQGLGTIAVLEHRPGASASPGGMLANLPTVSVDGVDVHELTTQLGTVLQWQKGGVDLVLAGSVTAKAAEAAAGDLLR